MKTAAVFLTEKLADTRIFQNVNTIITAHTKNVQIDFIYLFSCTKLANIVASSGLLITQSATGVWF